MDYIEKREVRFVIMKFLELPIAKQAEVYEQVNSKDKSMIKCGGMFLLSLLTDNSKEFAKLIGSFDNWIIWEEHRALKAALIWKHFKENLKKVGSGFKIPLIPLKRT